MDFEWLYVLFLTFFETSYELWPNVGELRLGEVRVSTGPDGLGLL
jgi:hypothetical protein